MVLVPAVVSANNGVKLLSCMVKFWMVIQSAPVILKIASFNKPPAEPVFAVIILLAAPVPCIVIVFTEVPVLVMLYPPVGAVSLPCNVITTGEVIVAAFKAVIAAAKVA